MCDFSYEHFWGIFYLVFGPFSFLLLCWFSTWYLSWKYDIILYEISNIVVLRILHKKIIMYNVFKVLALCFLIVYKI